MLLPGAIGARHVHLRAQARSELRQWSTYRSVGEWFDDYHGYVPIQMAAGLGMLIRTTGMSFPDAYRHLLQRGTIIHIEPADGAEPDVNVSSHGE